MTEHFIEQQKQNLCIENEKSILSSTGAGKEALIKNFVNGKLNIATKYYKIVDDRIKFTLDTIVMYLPKETPKYIKLDDIQELVTDENITTLTKEQLPLHIEKIYINTQDNTLPECELTIGRDFKCTSEHFEKIVLHCEDKNGSKRTSLSFLHIDDINEFRNLYVDTKGKVDIKQLSRKVMAQFGDIVAKDIKSRKAFRKKYFSHVENLVFIDMKEYGNLTFE